MTARNPWDSDWTPTSTPDPIRAEAEHIGYWSDCIGPWIGENEEPA